MVNEAVWNRIDGKTIVYSEMFRKLPKLTKHESLKSAVEHFKKQEDEFNSFEFMYIGDTVLIRNYYNGQFAWLTEYFETTEEDFNQMILEES